MWKSDKSDICFSQPSALSPYMLNTTAISLFTNIRISIKRPTDSSTRSKSWQTDTMSGQTSTANKQVGTDGYKPVLREGKRVLRLLWGVKWILQVGTSKCDKKGSRIKITLY